MSARILLNMPSQPAGKPTGVGRFGLELARRLAARGAFDLTFRSQYSAGQLPPELVKGAAGIITIPPVGAYLREVVESSLRGRARYGGDRFDLIVNIDPLGMASGGRKRLTIVHDLYYRAIPDSYSRFERLKAEAIHRLVIGRSHAIATVSETTAQDVRRFFPGTAGRITTIHSDTTLAADGTAPLPEGLEPDSYVLAVANVTPNKNFAVLADAFARIAAAHPHLRLVHVGGDAAGVFAAHLAPAGAADRLVRLTGVADEGLAALYRHALCLCVPSLYEGFCLPIVEAQKLACPVLFSERSASGEIGGAGGIAFDPDDSAALAHDLDRVVADAALRKKMRIDGLANAERFSWDRAVSQYETLFRSILQ